MSGEGPAAAMFQQLGDTPEQVASALKNKGIQGVRNTVRMLNPIVRYAQTQVAESLDMDVIKGDMLRMTFHDGRMEEIPIPPAVIEFLDAFNRGAYPDLEMVQG
jgi:hypothetical protein